MMRRSMLDEIGYMRRIDGVDWVAEIISERFDNALELMTPNSVIYGGAVRDALAKRPLEGDLDIAVVQSEFDTLVSRFLKNPRWIPEGEAGKEEITESDEPSKFQKTLDKMLDKFEKKKNSGDLAKRLSPMSKFTSFVNHHGMSTQLIRSKHEGRDSFQAALYPARMVDIVCCGVVLTADGEVFEVVPNAYQDCVEGVLNLNRGSETMYLESFPSRVEKLTGRGWKNLINVELEVQKIESARMRAEHKKKAIKARRAKRLGHIEVTEKTKGIKWAPTWTNTKGKTNDEEAAEEVETLSVSKSGGRENIHLPARAAKRLRREIIEADRAAPNWKKALESRDEIFKEFAAKYSHLNDKYRGIKAVRSVKPTEPRQKTLFSKHVITRRISRLFGGQVKHFQARIPASYAESFDRSVETVKRAATTQDDELFRLNNLMDAWKRKFSQYN